MERIKTSVRRLLIGLFIVVIILLMADFNNRMSDLHRLTAQRDRASGEMAELAETQASLETAIAYATSVEAVEEWAYEEGKMSRPGDQPVVPLPASQNQPTPTPAPVPETEPVPMWEIWLALFFDREQE